jgi:dCMP deaminase
MQSQQQNQPIYFLSTSDMLDHATRHWRVNYVTTDVISYDTLQSFTVRPFFLLVSLDAPVLERFARVNR